MGHPPNTMIIGVIVALAGCSPGVAERKAERSMPASSDMADSASAPKGKYVRRFSERELADLNMTYEKALAMEMGSTRSEPCARRFVQDNGRQLRPASKADRVRLARSGLAPVLVDGSNCIWRAGQLTGGGGAIYDVFLHQSAGGYASTEHRLDRLILLKAGRDVGGLYPYAPTSFRIVGPEIVFDHTEADTVPIRASRRGLPQSLILNGDIVTFERLPDPDRAVEPLSSERAKLIG